MADGETEAQRNEITCWEAEEQRGHSEMERLNISKGKKNTETVFRVRETVGQKGCSVGEKGEGSNQRL